MEACTVFENTSGSFLRLAFSYVRLWLLAHRNSQARGNREHNFLVKYRTKNIVQNQWTSAKRQLEQAWECQSCTTSFPITNSHCDCFCLEQVTFCNRSYSKKTTNTNSKHRPRWPMASYTARMLARQEGESDFGCSHTCFRRQCSTCSSGSQCRTRSSFPCSPWPRRPRWHRRSGRNPYSSCVPENGPRLGSKGRPSGLSARTAQTSSAPVAAGTQTNNIFHGLHSGTNLAAHLQAGKYETIT